ncbi:hypothetical protein E4U47_007093 [Claviceps purpurea]|nr:hypothetical protein E4U47_007093 [Claviceps purpurea]
MGLPQVYGSSDPKYALTLGAVTILALFYCFQWLKPQPFRLVNGRKFGELTNVRAKKEFMFGARQLIAKGLALAPGFPFRVIGDVGEILILPPKYAHEIRNHDHLSFTQAAFKLKLVTEPVSDECSSVLDSIYTNNADWHEIVAKDANLQLMARVTSRVFLGIEMCRNPQWLRITTTYAVVAFKAVEELRLWPAWLRPLVQWFLPHCTAARDLVRDARSLIHPLLEKRRIERNDAARRGERFECNDAIDWLEQTAQDKKLTYDPACAQLSLSVAALHSTTDFFTQVMLDIACNPELVEPLRKEIISVLGVAGWSKHSLYQLKLMDSVLKESQRLKPIAIASMRRMTTENIKLADGTVLPKNTLTLVSAHKHWDAGSYEEPHRFDGYRFYNLRQVPGKENVSQLVSVSPDHMGFGYGLHACPGRFFASEEIKLVLCHILLKYDFRLVEGTDIEPRKFGLNMNANPAAKLAVRRRQEEIIL